MDYRTLTTLLLKIVGVGTVIYAVSNIPAYFLNYYAFQRESFLYFLGISIVPFTLTLALGLALWFFPAKVTNTIVADIGDSASSLDAGKLQTVAICTLGMWVLVEGVGNLSYWTTYLTMTHRIEPGATLMTPDHYADLLSVASEIVLGLILLLGARGIAALIYRLRTFGLEK